MLEKTEVAIKNGQSRDTEDMGYTRHRTKTNKTKTWNIQYRQLKRWATTQHKQEYSPIKHVVDVDWSATAQWWFMTVYIDIKS
jgi:hypothetical protein